VADRNCPGDRPRRQRRAQKLTSLRGTPPAVPGEIREKRTVRYSLKEPDGGRTDRERLRKLTEEEFEVGAAIDPDNPLWPEEELRTAESLMLADEPKVPLLVRLYPEIVEFFRKAGPGYQGRINAVLLGDVRSRKAA
jgi:uncharacterized protein (DUF4415 family)